MRGIIVGLGVVLATARCEGTNTGNPDTPFTASDCRVGQEPPPGTGRVNVDSGVPIGTSTAPLVSNVDGGTSTRASSGALDQNEDDFYRLRCVAWELRGDGTLEVNLWNVGGGCSAHFLGGSARFKENALHLAAYEQGCEVSACGSCIYDFHFEARGATPKSDVPLFFDYQDELEKSCGEQGQGDTTKPIFTIPASTEPSGARCDSIFSVGFERPPVCVRHGACGPNIYTPPIFPQAICPVCTNGDVCGPIVESEAATQCLKPCTTDDECENAAMGCRNGGCTVVAKW